MRSAGAKHKFCFDVDGHVQCFAHTLQHAITDGLKGIEAIKETTAACRRLVEHFSKSVLASDALVTYQKIQGQRPLSLVQEVKTRWNSTFQMFK